MLLERSTVAIVAAGDPSPDHPVDLAAALATIGMSPTFLGRAERLEPRDATVAILDRIVGHQIDRAPAGFRVVAIMSVYNEEDILGPTLQALIDDRIDVYLIDNWSTDRTHQIAEAFLGRGLIAIERFPDQPTSVFELSGLLSRVEAIAAGIPSQWFIHHDADERREGPWPGHSLRDALWAADRAGFNAIDHTVLNFRPVDNGFVSGTDYVEYFRQIRVRRHARPAAAGESLEGCRCAPVPCCQRGPRGHLPGSPHLPVQVRAQALSDQVTDAWRTQGHPRAQRPMGSLRACERLARALRRHHPHLRLRPKRIGAARIRGWADPAGSPAALDRRRWVGAITGSGLGSSRAGLGLRLSLRGNARSGEAVAAPLLPAERPLGPTGRSGSETHRLRGPSRPLRSRSAQRFGALSTTLRRMACSIRVPTGLARTRLRPSYRKGWRRHVMVSSA